MIGYGIQVLRSYEWNNERRTPCTKCVYASNKLSHENQADVVVNKTEKGWQEVFWLKTWFSPIKLLYL